MVDIADGIGMISKVGTTDLLIVPYLRLSKKD
jgi:hypothetical protein